MRMDIFSRASAKAATETEVIAGFSATKKTEKAMGRIAARLTFATLLAAADLYLLFFLFYRAISGTSTWLLLIISTQLIFIFNFRRCFGKKPEVNKPFKQNY